MKNCFLAISLALGLMSVQSASAAMLTLTNMFDSGMVTMGSGMTVEGKSLNMPALNASNASIWKLDISDLGPSGVVDLDFDMDLDYAIGFDMSFTVPSFKNLAANTYYLSLFPKVANVPYEFTFSIEKISQVPVPGAIWLFGSALLGLLGFTTSRKPQSMLTA